MGARQLAADDPGVALLAGQLRQYGAGLGTERDHPAACLRVTQLDAVVLDVFPAQELDFRQPVSSKRRRAATAEGISPSASRRTSPRRSVSSGDRTARACSPCSA